ncbi:RNA polymerase-associated protein RapA [Candidatus Desulfarcum epimagneticum]|uniref:RNA polymerase-associated protein RapA n=1 Tax=uncultured Desulfobacteraceae bacterium TaxID=218296 RepID=A0A484HPH6_9BACT|nr:RNA polymerase-associated protein RapA [uncultured Desulfobacteraceae bacterium]
MDIKRLKPNAIACGPVFPEPVKVITVVPMGNSVKIIAEGLESGKVHQPVLSSDQIETLKISPDSKPYDGDSKLFRLGIESIRLGLAYEYDPYFSLSIARVDPLPHQLEAVYDYFLKLPRIRFLLADDPGAGKTIMAGLLIKELKVRGLIQRVLIVTPANLSFQWQRELKDRFHEDFTVIRSDLLRANYGANPWQELDQVITSVSWVSRIEDAKESLMRSHWDMIIIDEAHKMSAYSEDKKTLAYQLGESLSHITDHYLLMTATPHKGDPKNFSLFLRLLDTDVYADVKSIHLAMEQNEAPFYLRRVKEALITFPDQKTGKSKSLFTKRIVHTAGFEMNDAELDFYDALTQYVEDQSMRASGQNTAASRAVGFTMVMLQRRFASSIYAVRRTLERMTQKRRWILENPEEYRKKQIEKKIPDDFEDLPEDMRQSVLEAAEAAVISIDPQVLQDDIDDLENLVGKARSLEKQEVESKLVRLKSFLTDENFFDDPRMKLLIFTEHKDTLDYLVADGRDGRPLGKIREWGFNATQIHGGMKIGDRNTPGTRIYAEREFREDCQILVATEAAGEGINLQFCWYMINYDIPWNPNRLEQRMGRIHRYGQEKDCYIQNFVATNTREGKVFQKLFERIDQIEADLDPNRTGKVFNVLGDIFPANQIERMLRDMYAHNQMTEELIKSRIIEQVDTKRLREITESALEGLAKRSLNLSAIVSKSEEAKERRLVPEVIESFFLSAAPLAGVSPKARRRNRRVYRIGRLPRNLMPLGNELEPRFGRLGREYKRIVFDKEELNEDPTLEWVTPGHPLFECIRVFIDRDVRECHSRGAIFYDLHASNPEHLDVFSAEVRDGKANVLHKRLFVVRTDVNGRMTVKQPTIFLDLSLAPKGAEITAGLTPPDVSALEIALHKQALQPLLEAETDRREQETRRISKHMEVSLNAVIDRAQRQFAELMGQKESGANEIGLDGRLKMAEDRLDKLNNRLETRRSELLRERECAISNIRHFASAWALPHPDREAPDIKNMVNDPEIERIAVETVIAHEEARGWKTQSVESENRGFDIISRKPHPEDPQTSVEARFIEVKGRSHIGEVALTTNEFKTAERLQDDFWLYVVFNCATNPELRIVRNPARLGWKPIVKIEHYHIGPQVIIQGSQDTS